MHKQFIYAPLFILLFFVGTACQNGKRNNTPDRREAWLASLQDSISRLTALRQQDSLEINTLRDNIDVALQNFAVVNNPREVELYYILSEFKGAYPLSSTGVAARMLKSQQFELVAAHSGSKFNAIRLSSDGQDVTSVVVPNDQALNYSAGGLTTVAFSGKDAAPLGAFISQHAGSPVQLSFLQNGTTVSSIKLSDAQKRWISNTFDLTDTRCRLDSLETAQVLNLRKIQILYLTLQKDSVR